MGSPWTREQDWREPNRCEDSSVRHINVGLYMELLTLFPHAIHVTKLVCEARSTWCRTRHRHWRTVSRGAHVCCHAGDVGSGFGQEVLALVRSRQQPGRGCRAGSRGSSSCCQTAAKSRQENDGNANLVQMKKKMASWKRPSQKALVVSVLASHPFRKPALPRQLESRPGIGRSVNWRVLDVRDFQPLPSEKATPIRDGSCPRYRALCSILPSP